MHHRTLIHRFVSFSFAQLYTTFAWTYDAIAAIVSLGEWKRWGATVLDFLPHSVTSSAEPLLEIAHGPGHLHARMRAMGLRVLGIDLSAQMGRITRRHAGSSAALAQADALHLPFADHSFAAIICTFPAAFVFAPAALLEAARTLQPHGRFIVVPYATLRGRDPLTRAIRLAFRITGQSSSNAALEAHMSTAYAAAGMQFSVERVATPHADVTVWIGRPDDGRRTTDDS